MLGGTYDLVSEFGEREFKYRMLAERNGLVWGDKHDPLSLAAQCFSLTAVDWEDYDAKVAAIIKESLWGMGHDA